jgi:hypothetical protein
MPLIDKDRLVDEGNGDPYGRNRHFPEEAENRHF